LCSSTKLRRLIQARRDFGLRNLPQMTLLSILMVPRTRASIETANAMVQAFIRGQMGGRNMMVSGIMTNDLEVARSRLKMRQVSKANGAMTSSTALVKSSVSSALKEKLNLTRASLLGWLLVNSLLTWPRISSSNPRQSCDKKIRYPERTIKSLQ